MRFLPVLAVLIVLAEAFGTALLVTASPWLLIPCVIVLLVTLLILARFTLGTGEEPKAPGETVVRERTYY